MIEARGIGIARKGRRILAGASLTVAAGQIVTIEGASGSGKTTLLRVMAMLMEPDAGELWLDGADARRLSPMVYRTRVAYVLQQPPMLDGTVADNLASGPRLRGQRLPDGELAALLERVHLPQRFAGARARDLSGGERQRLALARALANHPEVLLLDEPTAALDPATATHVLETVRDLATGGLAIIVVTHQADHARLLGGDRYRCVDGAIAAA